jgi:hypothetical protein
MQLPLDMLQCIQTLCFCHRLYRINFLGDLPPQSLYYCLTESITQSIKFTENIVVIFCQIFFVSVFLGYCERLLLLNVLHVLCCGSTVDSSVLTLVSCKVEYWIYRRRILPVIMH